MPDVENNQADKVRKWQQITVISPYSRELGLRLHEVEPDWCVIKVLPDEQIGRAHV